MAESNPRRIVFLGPSLPLGRAKLILPDADYRPPIRRGDLDAIAPGTVVGLVDGLFAQTLAISPGEIREAVGNGVAVYGAASMGALRAAEIPSVIGVGRVFQMYREGVIERDDEVAVVCDADTYQALTEPLVNVRFAVERLVRSGTLNRRDGAEIIQACLRLHYTERTYPKILAESTLARNKDVDEVIRLLRNVDLKCDDAQLLLETIATAKAPPAPLPGPRQAYVQRSPGRHKRVNARESILAPVMVWESGDEVQITDLILFLKVTGKFDVFARNVIGRMAAAGADLTPAPAAGGDIDVPNPATAAQSLLDGTRAQWGWESPEEAHVTMRDLGLGLEDVADSLDAEASLRRIIWEFGADASKAFSKALRAELWMNELSLKRETLRLGSLKYFAREGAAAGPPREPEIREARGCVARLRGAFRWKTVSSGLDALGVRPDELDATVREIALARRAAGHIIAVMDRPPLPQAATARSALWQSLGIDLTSSPKAAKSARFSLDEAPAADKAQVIAKQMGVRRIGMVGELDTLGIYIAQAFGERSGWSSSFSSGKAETRDGARVGSIMEEVEIHAQDAYSPRQQIRASYAEASSVNPMVHPRELGLPFDSRYRDDLVIDWAPCLDLVDGRTVYVPSAALLGDRQTNDVFYCPRLGGKIFSSSGLGSGFSMPEAIVHASAEYIERHAYRLAEIEIDNPGGVGLRPFFFVDERSLPETPARIVEKYHRAGMCVRFLDITSEAAIPTFFARVYDDLFDGGHSVSSDGFACHPDPEVAVTMALLEAAQTRGGYIAGGREDYSLQARSLGRHERPRTAVPRSQTFWFSNDRPVRSLQWTPGLVARDILQELEWMVDRVTEAGFPMFLVADYTIPSIRPAYAVRVLIPGMETTNPMFTGPRARATVLRDLMPRGQHAR